jgi:hypothetical protein
MGMRYSKTILAISLFSFILFLSALCSKKSAYPVQTELIDGVKVITNPDFPRDGTVQYAMEEELSIGADEADEKALLNFPREVKVADDGTIYVMDWRDVCIKVYDSNGKYLRSVGRKGEGPGEFNTPVYMDLSPDGRIFLLDGSKYRTVILDGNGNHLGGFRLEGYHSGMKTDDMNRLYFSKRTPKKSHEELPITKEYLEVENDVTILRTDSGGENMFQFGPFSGEKDPIRRADKDNYLMGPPLYSIVWTVDEEGKLYQGFNQYYRINVFDPEGNQLFAFGREYIPVKNKRYSGRSLQLKDQPPFKPGGWILDEKGNLWILIYSENEDEEVYDVFSPEGIYLKQVTLPHLIYQLKNKKAYSIVSTEEGFRVVKRFRLREKAETK